MQLRTVRLALSSLAIASGSALSQLDSAAARTDSASAAAPAPVPVPDTLAPPVAALPTVDTASAGSSLVAPPDTAPAPPPPAIVTPVATPVTPAVGDGTPRAWTFEAKTSYGWRMGQLLREEDRLTRAFKIVLIGKNQDTSNVRPIASGTEIQASGWWNATAAQAVGIGFGFGRYGEHPVSSYSSALTETFFDQFLLTARYTLTHEASAHLRLFGEGAVGWNRSRIERIPLVAVHRNDDLIQFKQAERDQIAGLNLRRTVDGVHVQGGLGIRWMLPQSWSLSLSGAATWDRIWFERSMASTVEGSSVDVSYLSDSPAFWGLDLSLAVSRDF